MYGAAFGLQDPSQCLGAGPRDDPDSAGQLPSGGRSRIRSAYGVGRRVCLAGQPARDIMCFEFVGIKVLHQAKLSYSSFLQVSPIG